MKSMTTAIGFLLMFPVLVMAQTTAPAEILSAYATSSSFTSSSILSLLDGSGQGAWTPESKDFGTDEGIYVQFTNPVPVNYIEIVLKGEFDPKGVSLDCYLDGKTGVTGGEKVEFWAVPEDSPGGKEKSLVFKILQRVFSNTGSQDIPLNSKIRSFYFRIVNDSKIRFGGSPTVAAIRFIGPGDAVIPVKLPKIVPTEVKASSVLEPFTAYQPANLFDSKPDFAWSTDGKKSDGVGETVDMTFSEPQTLGGMVVWNGYQRSDTHYQANGRISQLEVSSDQGAPQTIELKDKMGPQKVLFPTPISGVRKLRLKIAGIYPGSKYKDVLLSELRFLEPDNGLILPTAALSVPSASPEYQAYLDKTWASIINGDEDMDTPNNSLRIRSNGTFVLYQITGGQCEGGCADQRISEGNWEFSGDAFRIFGKKYTLTYMDSVYLQSGKAGEAYGIFQSPLTLTPYKTLPIKKRLEILKKILPSEMLRNEQTPNVWAYYLPDMNRKGLSADSYEALMSKLDQHLLAIHSIYAESNDLSDILVPNDKLNMEVTFE